MNTSLTPHVKKSLLVGICITALAAAACGTTDESSIDSNGSDASSVSDQTSNTDPDIDMSSGLVSDYLGDYELEDAEYGTMTTVGVVDGVRTIETNALPNHDTGDFPNDGNPNTISAQDLSWEFPSEGEYIGDAAGVRTTGVALNGVKFEPGTAETVSCDSGETYRVEALQDIYDLGLDFNNAHVQPTGEYHYHGVSQMLVDAYDEDTDLVHVGFAADGFLIYYSKSGAYSPSYRLTDTARAGSSCVMSLPGSSTFDLDGSTPDGTYSSDYAFDASSGDLDECNGTTVDGEYVYLVTDTYPFVGRCLNGNAAAEAGGGAPPSGAPGA